MVQFEMISKLSFVQNMELNTPLGMRYQCSIMASCVHALKRGQNHAWIQTQQMMGGQPWLC